MPEKLFSKLEKIAQKESGAEEGAEEMKENVIGERYDVLLEQRKELTEQLSEKNLREYSVVFDREFVDDKTFRELVDEWLAGVRAKTDFLKPLDRLGIEIFKDDLEVQPNFPDEKITFGSQEILEERIARFSPVGGRAKRYVPKIEILLAKPPLWVQVAQFFSKGVLSQEVSVLIHELIHRYHHSRGDDINGVLTEAQAYFSGIFEAGPNFSLTKIAATLRQPQEEKGLYEYDTDQVIEALTTVFGLYALGLEDDKIAELISQSHYDYETREFVPLSGELERMKKEKGVDELDLQALDDINRLRINNQRLAARLEFFQVIDKKYSKKELREAKIKTGRSIMAMPEYWHGGAPVPARSLLQKVICPANKDFPYDPQGKRTGIIFGNFPESAEKTEFGIGRWEAEGKESVLDIAKTPEETDRYLSILTERAKDIRPEYKGELLDDYISAGILLKPLAQKILKTLISKEETKGFLKERSEHYKNIVAIVDVELDSIIFAIRDGEERGYAYALDKNDIIKVYAHKMNLEDMETVFGAFELKVADVDEFFGQKVDALKKKIGILEAEIEKAGMDESMARQIEELKKARFGDGDE